MWFHTMAASRLLFRRKSAVARMLATACIGSLWCVVGVAWILGMLRETDAIASNVQLRVSMRQGVGADTVQMIKRALSQMPAVHNVSFTSGRSAAHEFFHAIDVQDPALEEIISVPDVLNVTPQRDFCTTQRMQMLERTMRSTYPEVEHVVWPTDLVLSIERRTNDLFVLGLVVAGMTLIIFALALTYAFRAEIHKADSDLTVGWIMGARSWFIATPHWMVGIVATVLGAALAALCSAIAWQWALPSIPWLVRVRPEEIGITVVTCAGVGCVMSVWQSVVAARQAARHV